MKIKTIITDCSNVIIFPKIKLDVDGLDELYQTEIIENQGNFSDFFGVNEQLLNLIGKYRQSCTTILFTEEESKIHLDNCVFSKFLDVFDFILTTKRVGCNKSDPVCYKRLIDEFALQTTQTSFIDDKEENLNAAQKSGLQIVKYQSNINIQQQLQLQIGF